MDQGNGKNRNGLPKGWEWTKLKNVCKKILGGGTPSTKEQEYWQGNIPWISSADIEGLRHIKPRRKITREAVRNSATNILPKGGIIVVTRVGLGKIAIAPYDLCFSQDSQGLILNEKMIGQAYALIYLSKEVQKFKHESRGTTINGVTKKQLAELDIPLPPIPEQEQISSKIEELFSELDKGIEQLKTTQQQLKVYRQAVLKRAFEGRLTNENVKEGELPKGWQITTLTSVCKEILGGGTPTTKNEAYWNGNIPWISSADVYGLKDVRPRRYINKDAIENSTTNLLPKGGIIVVTRVGLGKIAIAPFELCFNQDNQGLVLNDNLILKEYALLFLHRAVQLFLHESRGTTINGVTKKQLSELEIRLPSLQEQDMIAKEVDSCLSVADKLAETIMNCLEQTEALRQSILKKAFEGRLV